MSRQQRRRGCYCRRLVAVASAGAVIILAGCSFGARDSAHQAAAALSAGCSTSVAAGRPLAGRSPVTLPVPGSPTAVVGTADGRWAFASESTDVGGEIAVIALGREAPRLVRVVKLPSLTAAFGMAMTHDGTLLVVAGYRATAVLSVRALEDGASDPVAGTLADAGAGQFEVAVSADDRYVFVTDETTGGLSVFDLALALRRGFSAHGVAAGIVPLAPGAVGVAMSPDGGRLYVTTYGAYGPHGRLWVIDTARAENGADGAAILAQVPAGCQPVRVAVSPDGSIVWVTALQSNALLGFSAADLRDDPSHALQAVVRVGAEPVGLVVVDDGRLALVGNSNRGLVPGTGSDASQTVSVINTAAALARRPAVVGEVPTGLFPRDLTFDQGTGQVLLGNYNSGTIEEFPVPIAPRPRNAASDGPRL
jgi:DNA-binding beta-propeller fold protein YncE